MKSKVFLITVLVLLAACDSRPQASSSVWADSCKSVRNPGQLDELLECLTKKYDRNDAVGLDRSDKMCDYLPAAVRFIQSNHRDDLKDGLVINSMMSLPLTDYLNTWAPAVMEGYVKGTVAQDKLSRVFFPYGNRVDMYLAYDAPIVQQYYRSLVNEPRVAEVKIGIFPQWDTVGKHAQAILSGEATKVIKTMIDHGELQYTPAPLDLTTTCARRRVE